MRRRKVKEKLEAISPLLRSVDVKFIVVVKVIKAY